MMSVLVGFADLDQGTKLRNIAYAVAVRSLNQSSG